MSSSPFITFCIPVYNQAELLRYCIEHITPYQGGDIEILVCDNCSTEDIRAVAESFGDDRISYYRNPENYGQDANILEAFSHARGDYLYLLRTKDFVLHDRIARTISTLRARPNIAYHTASALDEMGRRRISYERDAIALCGADALAAHEALYIHPSGSTFKNNLLDYGAMRAFIDDFGGDDRKFLFLSHYLMRMQLSQMGDFYLQSEPNWIYTNSMKAADKSVNLIPTGEYVYSPRLAVKRMLGEMLWARRVLPEDLFEKECLYAVQVALPIATYLYDEACRTADEDSHYGSAGTSPGLRQLNSDFLTSLEAAEFEVGLNSREYRRKRDELVRIAFAKNALRFHLGPIYPLLGGAKRAAKALGSRVREGR